MNQETAKTIFDILVAELKKNDLTEIVFFILDSNINKNNIDSIHDVLYYLNVLSEENPEQALAYLLKAGIEYINKAKSIPNIYKDYFTEIYDTGDNSTFTKDIYWGEQNLSIRLSDEKVEEVLLLFKSLYIAIDSSNDDKLNRIFNS